MELNLDSLTAFSVFSETLNFTRAAEQLFISQPALHVKIKKLSQQLGVPLYTKQGKLLQLTTFGKDVARFARETQSNVDTFVEELLGTEASRAVTLAAGRGCYLYLLGGAISRFKKKCNSNLKLITSDSQRTVELIETGQAQMGVTVLQSRPTGVVSKLISNAPAMLVVPAKHPLAERRSIGVTNMKDLELIVPPDGKPHRTMISKMLEMKNVAWSIAMEAEGWDLTLEFVRLGMGSAIVNGCCKFPKGVVGIPISDFPGTKYFLITKRSCKLTGDQKSLYDLILSSSN